jgi:hypothetical protein
MKEPSFETEDVIDYRMGLDRCRPARARSGHRAALIPGNRFSFRNITETRKWQTAGIAIADALHR